MSRFKSKMESTEENTNQLLFSKDEIKRKPNAMALQFEQMKFEEDQSVLSPKTSSKDWNWKKKTAQELHEEAEGPKEKSEPTTKKSHSFQDTKFNELLADINAVKQRLNERDAVRQEKENERKLREMEDAIREVQEALRHDEEESFENQQKERKLRRTERKETNFDEKKNDILAAQSSNKIGELKSQLMSMINDENNEKSSKQEVIDVNVSALKSRLIQNEEKPLLEDSREKRVQNSNSLVSKLAEKLVGVENDYEDLPLTKAPKRILKVDNLFENNEAPSKTLEELKEENQNKKWAWKEKDMTDIQNYIAAYDDIAPNKIKSQHQKLIELDEEQRVVESLTKDKDTAILVQLREEKEQEFEKFMTEIHSYLKEGNKDSEEVEFKRGMQGYMDLIGESDQKPPSSISLPKLQLNTVSKMKSSLFEENEEEPRKPSPKVQKLDRLKIERELTEQNSAKSKTSENVINTQNLSSVKKIFEANRKEEPKPEQRRDPSKPSIVEKFKRMAMDEKQKRYQHQLQHKLKTISDLHIYIQNHENLGNENISYLIRDFKACKENEKLSCHQKFMNALENFLNQNNKSEEEATFRSNIQAYLSILNNVNSIYNATPKLKKHNGSRTVTQSNMKKAILEKSTERKPIIETKKEKKEEPKQRVLSPEERKREILAKYGFKDRSAIVIQQLSDDSDSSESEDEEDIKKLTDKQLAEKYGLPYFEVPEEERTIEKSNSAVGYTSLLSKIRNIQNEKSTSVTTGRERFENFKDSPQDSPLVTRKNSYEPTNTVTMRMKKKLEEQPVAERKSWAYENEEILSYGATSKIKQRFECESPDGSRSNSPAAAADPGTVMTSKMKKLFEEKKECPQSPLQRSRGLMKSSTVSNIGANFTTESPLLRHKTVEKYFERERRVASPKQSPQVPKKEGIEKSLSMSKIKNAFEVGIGLFDEAENVDELHSRKSIQAELDLLRSPSSKDISSPMVKRKLSQPETDKSSLVASFFSGAKVASSSQKTNSSPNTSSKVQKSSTMSDISSYLKFKVENVKKDVEAQPSPKAEQTKTFSQGIAKSSSFSKFKNAFEDGVGIMDTETVDNDKFRVNAELNALKSSNKIQSMFRINKSKTPSERPEDRAQEEMVVVSSEKPDKKKEEKPNKQSGSEGPERRQQRSSDNPEEGELQGRKWVFDTIQKYFDVIVEEEEEGEEDEEDEDGDEDRQSDSESDYTSAEDELPQVALPPINKTLPTRQLPTPSYKDFIARRSPSFSQPLSRPRASTGMNSELKVKEIHKKHFLV